MNTFPIRPRRTNWLDSWLSENKDIKIEGYTDTDPVRVILTVTDVQYDCLMIAAGFGKGKESRQLMKHLTLAKARHEAGEPPIPVKAARPNLGAAARGEVATARRQAKERIQEMRDSKPLRIEGDVRVKATKAYWMEWVQRNRIKHTNELRVDVKSNYIVVELHPKDALALVNDTMKDANDDSNELLKKKATTMWKLIGEQFADQDFKEWA